MATRTSASTATAAPSAAICVVANEVLKGRVRARLTLCFVNASLLLCLHELSGQLFRSGIVLAYQDSIAVATHDTNSFFIAKLMFRRGVDVKRIVVIPDELDIISSTVKELSDLVGPTGYVFTTGGIGPTHDDLTYEGVARAFGVGLELHEPTAEALRAYARTLGRTGELNEDVLRMAMLPVGCKILETGSWVPLAIVHNVYVLPGIPSMVRDMLTYNEEHFVGVPIHRAIVHTMSYEGVIATPMKAIQKKYSGVVIGSYVNLTQEKTGIKDESYNSRLTVEGRDADEVETVANELIAISNGTRFQTGAL